jgi:hypothetical protein
MRNKGEEIMRPSPRIVTSMVVLLCLGACTWVKPTEDSANVVVSDGSGVSNCLRKGEVEASLKSRVGGFERNATKVAGELETLARNEAVKLGGDTIVAESNVRDGSKTYGVYRCRP